jgi:hypothetical protein
MSYLKGTTCIQSILTDMHAKNTISHRELTVLKAPLMRIDYYCYAILEKRQAESVERQVGEMARKIVDN